jgi:hypothetical protein
MPMFEPFSAFLASLKDTTPVIFGGVAIACGVLLFGGSGFVEALDLIQFREENRALLGWGFLLSSSILLSQVLFKTAKFLQEKIQECRAARKKEALRAAQISQLSKLTPDEKAYLLPYVRDQKASQTFPLEDGIRGSLEAKGIIFQASQMGNLIDGWAYNLQPWAREHLESNMHLLDGAAAKKKRQSHW